MKRKLIAIAALIGTGLVTIGGTVAATTDDAGRGVKATVSTQGRGV